MTKCKNYSIAYKFLEGMSWGKSQQRQIVGIREGVIRTEIYRIQDKDAKL